MNWRTRTTIIYLAFLLTGVGTALLGAALPAMLREWRLSDSTGGLLLFSSFAGATAGVLFAGVAPRFMAGVGLLGSGVAALLLSVTSPRWLPPCFLLYGSGLGTTMTSISLLRSREVRTSETSLELSRLNLVWATGACLAPAFALRSLRLVSVASLFKAEVWAFGLLGAALLAVARWSGGPGSIPEVPQRAMQRLAPVRMCVFAAAAVGLETAIGSWLTAYTQRMAHDTGIAVTANSAFWLGLLLSRAAHSVTLGRRLQSRTGLLLHIVCVTFAMLLLVEAPAEALLPAAAFLAGLGLGPLYPLVLSWALPRYRSSGVFMLAGAGASVLPWLTGVVSTSLGSLRGGLLAPCGAVLALWVAAVFMRHDILGPDEIPAGISTIHSSFSATEHKL